MPRGQPAGDTPNVREFDPRQCAILCRFIYQQRHAPVFLIFLRDVVGKFGKRFGRPDTHRYRNASPLQHGGTQRSGMAFKPLTEALQAEKGFVD